MAPSISDYMKAGYPVLHVQTMEYESAEEAIISSLLSLSDNSGSIDETFRLGIWKSTTGLLTGTVGDGAETVTEDKSLLQALARVQEATEDHPILCILHNPQDELKDYVTAQGLLDAAYSAKSVGSHIVMIGPYFELPTEIKNIVTRIVLPLPSQEDLLKLFSRLSIEYAEKIKDPDGTSWDKSLVQTKNKKGDIVSLDLADYQVEILREAAAAAVGLDTLNAENALSLSITSRGGVDIGLIQTQKEQEIAKSDVLEFISPRDTMDEVGGFSVLKEWLAKRKKAFSTKAREYGLSFPKGILLLGFAGTGKSLAAKAIGTLFKLPLIRFDMGKAFRSYYGESEAAVRAALTVAEAVSPCILWLDELEKALAGSKSSGQYDSGVTARVVSTLLTWRAETTAPVVLVGTANDISQLDSTVYRKGRFDEIWYVGLPNESEREEIFRIHLRKRGRDPEKFNLELLSGLRSEHFVGAEIEAAIEEALFESFDQDREIETGDIMAALEKIKPQAGREPDVWKKIAQEWSLVARPVSSSEKKDPTKQRSVRTLK